MNNVNKILKAPTAIFSSMNSKSHPNAFSLLEVLLATSLLAIIALSFTKSQFCLAQLENNIIKNYETIEKIKLKKKDFLNQNYSDFTLIESGRKNGFHVYQLTINDISLKFVHNT